MLEKKEVEVSILNFETLLITTIEEKAFQIDDNIFLDDSLIKNRTWKKIIQKKEYNKNLLENIKNKYNEDEYNEIFNKINSVSEYVFNILWNINITETNREIINEAIKDFFKIVLWNLINNNNKYCNANTRDISDEEKILAQFLYDIKNKEPFTLDPMTNYELKKGFKI